MDKGRDSFVGTTVRDIRGGGGNFVMVRDGGGDNFVEI